MKNKKRISFVYDLKRIIKMALKEEPKVTYINFMVGILQTACMVLTTVLIQKLFDAVSFSIIKQELLRSVIIFLVLFGLMRIFAEILNGLQNYMYGIYIDKLEIKFGNLLNKKCQFFDANYFNDSIFLDDLEKARKGITNSVELLLVTGDIITYYGLYFVFMGIYLYTVKPYFILLLLLVFFPTLLSHIYKMKTYSDLEDETVSLRRQKNHFFDCVKGQDYFKDTRTLGISHYFKDKYFDSLSKFSEKQIITEKKNNKREILAKVITFLGYASILLILSYTLITGEITVGAFGAIFASINSMFSLMEEMISFHIGQMAEEIATVDNFIKIMDTDIKKEPSNVLPPFDYVLLKNVSFHYPNNNKNALQNINLVLRKGETLALVGENGSGKSTLSKIITGLYKPTEGEVIYGKDVLEKIDENEKNERNKITALFQNFCKYKLTLRENIILGDITSKKDIHEVSSILNDTLEKSNLDPDSILGPEFGGCELSGGQWQRLATARTFYKDASVVLLDEPTAAIDPIQENEMYETFQHLLGDKTAVIVTHRLGSIRFANQIAVLRQGQIVEQGSHAALMKESGVYSQMYLSQAEQY